MRDGVNQEPSQSIRHFTLIESCQFHDPGPFPSPFWASFHCGQRMKHLVAFSSCNCTIKESLHLVFIYLSIEEMYSYLFSYHSWNIVNVRREGWKKVLIIFSHKANFTFCYFLICMSNPVNCWQIAYFWTLKISWKCQWWT